MKQRPVWLYVVGAIVLALGLYLVVPNRDVCASSKTIEKLEQTCEITYQGVEGKTALELLGASHQVETQKFDFGEFVQSIDGIKPGTTHFWAFYVNGEQAQVGADSYQTKNNDKITWKLEKIQAQ